MQSAGLDEAQAGIQIARGNINNLRYADEPGARNATHSRILAWRIPCTEEPGGLQSMASQKSWTRLSTHTRPPEILLPFFSPLLAQGDLTSAQGVIQA